MAATLYGKKGPQPTFSIEEILRCYSLLIGACTFELPITVTEWLHTNFDGSEQELLNQLNRFIGREFGYIKKDYTNYAALEFLEAFSEYMDEHALLLYKKLLEFREQKKRRKDNNLPQAILDAVKYKPLSNGQISRKVRAGYTTTSRETAKLAKAGLLECIPITKSDGSIRLTYCQPEVVKNYPHLIKICGVCVLYNKRFGKCALYELLAAFHTSSYPMEYLEYIRNYICYTATACEHIITYSDLEINGETISYTIAKEELEQKIRDYGKTALVGLEDQAKYLCVHCGEQIAEFGTRETIVFPRRKVQCPNCSTGYFKKTDKLIQIQIGFTDILRQSYYKVAGSVPKKLMKLKPSYKYTIYDHEHADMVMGEDGSLVLEVCKHRVPLEKVKGLYFAGHQHKKLESFLEHLVKVAPERFTLTIGRSQQQEHEEIELRANCKPFTYGQYQLLQKLVTYIAENELLNNSILVTRNLSTIGGMIGYRKFTRGNNGSTSKIEQQLYELVDLFMVTRTGVQSSYYCRLLEAQNQDCIYDLTKEAGLKVNLWTHGRVLSRLVKNIFLSSTIRVSNARSPLDALINQVLRQFRFCINKIFRKVELNPASMGAGLFHRRKTKSAIDQKGLYFDLIEAVVTLALFTILKALAKGLFSSDDCSLELLDGQGHKVYRVKHSSLKKIEELVKEALEEQVFYQGKSLPFLEVFEENLFSFRKAILLWFEMLEEKHQLTAKEIIQCLKEADYTPFIYCPVECRAELAEIYDFAGENKDFFEGREAQVLIAQKERKEFRDLGRKKWLLSNGKQGKEKRQLTKHQQKGQERSLLIAVTLMTFGLELNGYFGYYSTSQIREIFNLTQNQDQRILTQMVTQGLVLKLKSDKQAYYQLNLENGAVHELLFAIGNVPSDEARTEDLVNNAANVLSRVKAFLLKVQQHKQGLPVTLGWRGWKPSTVLERLLEHLSYKITIYEMTNFGENER